MATNQTIDGVPSELRDLLERVAAEANHMLWFTYASNYDECRAAVDELRALLDAPTVETVGLTAWQKGRDAMRDERDYWMEKCTNGGNPVYQVMSLTDGHGWQDVTLERYQVANSAPEFNKVRVLYDDQATQPQGEPVAWLNVATGHITTSAVVVMDWDDEKERVQSLYAEQPAPVAVVMPERLAQILKFLEGAENLDGYWFGEPGPHGSKVWWRAELRKALTETNLFAKQQ